MSCLLSNPPDYDVVDQRPVVVRRRPTTAVISINKDDPRTSATDFSVDAWDGDEDQLLRQRWLLDFRQDRFPCQVVSEPGDVARPNSDGTQTAGFRLVHFNLTVGVCYRLSVVLTDGEWEDSEETSCVSVVQGANRIIENWFLTVYDDSFDPRDVPFVDCEPIAGVDP